MPAEHHIRNPFEIAVEQIGDALSGASARPTVRPRATLEPLAVRRIGLADLREALVRGVSDMAASRGDVLFVAIVYPLAGLLLFRLALDANLAPLVFPLIAGFALVGPAAAVGLYEMSRRRERGESVSWRDAFGVLRSPRFPAVFQLGIVMLGVFVLWLAVAYVIYQATLGPQSPSSLPALLRDALTTGPGWAMIVVGCAVGALFAAAALAMSAVSFPLLVDRDVSVVTALRTSLRATFANPAPMAAWGLIVAAALVVGSLPALVGLIVVMPVLGHATWHLYRRIVP